MHWSFMQTGGNSIKRALAALAVTGIFLWAAPGYAARFDQRGVSVPDAPELGVPMATRLSSTDHSAALTLPRDPQAAWQLLNQVLAGLGIKSVQRDEGQRRLRTDWVLWTWDPDSGTGNSKPPLKALSRTYERHRFEFTVGADAAGKGAVIEIRDAARQREVDITPDSEYTWLKWTDAELQAAAAQSFLHRLQGDIESALSTSIIPVTGSPPRIIEAVEPATHGDQTSSPLASGGVAPAAVIVEPATAVVPAPEVSGEPAQRQRVEQPVEAQTALPADSGAPPPPVPATPPVKADAIERTEQTPIPKELAASPKPPAPVATPSAHADNPPLPAAPRAVQGGLLVNAGPDATWQALREALDALGVKLQSSDQRQHMLTTEWIDANYDRKNQQFLMESKNEERWAFNVWGKGRQRHRFQLILIPVDGAVRTMIYAYHTGFQEETDRTPDSSQTLLYWKDHATEPAIAMAFLRRLRLVVNP
ncbi:MAG: hypothetical protein WAL92_13620 [Thiogranum sp.]